MSQSKKYPYKSMFELCDICEKYFLKNDQSNLTHNCNNPQSRSAFANSRNDTESSSESVTDSFSIYIEDIKNKFDQHNAQISNLGHQSCLVEFNVNNQIIKSYRIFLTKEIQLNNLESTSKEIEYSSLSPDLVKICVSNRSRSICKVDYFISNDSDIALTNDFIRIKPNLSIINKAFNYLFNLRLHNGTEYKLNNEATNEEENSNEDQTENHSDEDEEENSEVTETNFPFIIPEDDIDYNVNRRYCKSFLEDIKYEVIADIDNECIICFHKVCKSQFMVSLPCAHSYHYNCFDQWYRIRGVCPICKLEI